MHTRDTDVMASSKDRALRYCCVIFALLQFACGRDDRKTTCFAPQQNLEIAYSPGAAGCECKSASDKSVCIRDRDGRDVALVCSDDRWIAVEDGPCLPTGP